MDIDKLSKMILEKECEIETLKLLCEVLSDFPTMDIADIDFDTYLDNGLTCASAIINFDKCSRTEYNNLCKCLVMHDYNPTNNGDWALPGHSIKVRDEVYPVTIYVNSSIR